ncbi:hypothetical protein CDL15_Pgr020310 [Punica granatum]|uniref:DRBM domain-containing protein n=1 Tax=Punica granatum TaxID=22663 RepID=A0A218Y3H9_PUNGR|nr:hypothetical protein CDL15_Pgr020310 [Punica granatum]
MTFSDSGIVSALSEYISQNPLQLLDGSLCISGTTNSDSKGFPCESSTAFYVYVDDELVGSGEYRPKKEIAINRAAKNALEKLEIFVF